MSQRDSMLSGENYTSQNPQLQLESEDQFSQMQSQLQSQYTSKRSSKSRQSKQSRVKKQQVDIKRSTKQQQREPGRNYGCPCGKFYLSAPALYTHVKMKHHGIPPGNLVKPAPHSGLRVRGVRGRARYFKNSVIVQNIEEDSDCLFDVVEQVQKKLENISIKYQDKLQTTLGDHSCEDMASRFIYDLRTIHAQQMKVVNCFLIQLKQFMCQRFDPQYWSTKEPDEIIVIANDFIKNHNNEPYKSKYPLSNMVLIDLTFILCKWMYKQKWTNNKLIRRYSPAVTLPDPSSIVARRK